MFGRFSSRSLFAMTLLAFGAALAGDALAMPWQLEQERGIGGGPEAAPAKAASRQDAPDLSDKRVGVTIVIERDDEPVIRAAEGVPVSPFGDQPSVQAQSVADLARREEAAAAAALQTGQNRPARVQAEKASDVAVAARLAPITAQDLLKQASPRLTETTEVAALSGAVPSPRPAARPLTNVVSQPAPKPIEQAQFSPGTLDQPNALLSPRADQGAAPQAASPVISPSPRKPQQPATVQPVVVAPNVAASPKASILRQGPTPDNTQVELVQPPTGYSLTVAAGTSQLLNSSKPVYNIIASDPNVANAYAVSPTQIAVHGIGLGSTNMFGIGDGGELVFAINVDTVPNAKFAQSQLRAAAPESTTNVSLNSGTLVAGGGVTSVNDAITVANVTDGLQRTQGPTVNNTTIDGSQQVKIHVRFAEISRNDVFNLGINWNAIFDSGDFLFGLSTGNFLSSVGDLSAREIGSIDGEEFGRFDFNGDFGDVSVDAFIDALQREGIVNLLAEPSLTSVNGEPASFLAGGEVPIPVPGGAGGDTVTIDYKQFGVQLDFIPTLLSGNRINLRVRPEVSTIASSSLVLDGFAAPSFTVRRAETSIELASGQTFAIAGLFQRDLLTDTDKFPVLGDVPVLGQLFQSERFQRRETELVILITPYLVKPTSNNNIALPNDRLGPAGQPATVRDGKRAGFIVN
jgi:pilus assembly protein CpaC